MAFQDVTKQDILNGFTEYLSSVLGGYPGGYLTQEEAEGLQQTLAQKGYEEAGKVIDPDKEYPDLRF